MDSPSDSAVTCDAEPVASVSWAWHRQLGGARDLRTKQLTSDSTDHSHEADDAGGLDLQQGSNLVRVLSPHVL